MRVVIDTNVLIAANGRFSTGSSVCAARCARMLLDVQQDHILLDDTADHVFLEYKTYCNFSGQPGPGDRFFLWYLRARWTQNHVARVNIGTSSEEVLACLPASLAAFDRSDHKWIALFLVGGADVVYNALDSDWSHSRDELATAGIIVRELCEKDLKK